MAKYIYTIDTLNMMYLSIQVSIYHIYTISILVGGFNHLEKYEYSNSLASPIRFLLGIIVLYSISIFIMVKYTVVTLQVYTLVMIYLSIQVSIYHIYKYTLYLYLHILSKQASIHPQGTASLARWDSLNAARLQRKQGGAGASTTTTWEKRATGASRIVGGS